MRNAFYFLRSYCDGISTPASVKFHFLYEKSLLAGFGADNSNNTGWMGADNSNIATGWVQTKAIKVPNTTLYNKEGEFIKFHLFCHIAVELCLASCKWRKKLNHIANKLLHSESHALARF